MIRIKTADLHECFSNVNPLLIIFIESHINEDSRR